MSNRGEIDTVKEPEISTTEWHDYAVGHFPDDLVVDGAIVPRPVIVQYENGHEEDDYIFKNALMFFCVTACVPIYGPPKRWRYRDSKDEFMRKVEAERLRRNAVRYERERT